MNEKEKLENLKNEFDNIEIPKELDFIVNKTIKECRKENEKNKFSILKKTGIGVAAAFVIFVTGINLSPALAQTLSDIPVIGSVVKVFTFRNYSIKEEGFDAEINIPKIEGLGDKEIEEKLNKEFIENGQKMYNDFIKEMEQIKESGNQGHKSVVSEYEVKTDNDKIISIVITNFMAEGSSDTQYKTYTVDKLNKSIVTLKSLFENNEYIDVISSNIKEQMIKQMESDENIYYFVDDEMVPESNFKQIKENQNFYINNEGKLVIMFDKYEVAPGYMGTSEFVIPTEEIKGLLLDRNLIK